MAKKSVSMAAALASHAKAHAKRMAGTQPAVVKRARSLDASEKRAGPYGKPQTRAFR